VGITRDAYGARETAAGDILMDFAHRHGLEAGYDRVGNLNVTPGGRFQEEPELLIGSHIDSVPRGGNYDGLAGVIAGIATLTALEREKLLPKTPVRVLGFRGEESPWFGTAYLGSKLFLGQLPQREVQALRRVDTGKTLGEHMQQLGLDVSRIGEAPVHAIDRVKAYLELHIEQGPLLESIGRPVGIATSIRGNIRYPFATCFGRYAHSGAAPLHLRSDALVAAAKLVAFAYDCCRAFVEDGNDDLVFTCGIFHTDAAEHAMTKVPGQVTFSLNIGATRNELMEEVHRSILAHADHLMKVHKVRFDLGPRVGTPAVELDRQVADAIDQAGIAIGVPAHRMPTVGHDAALFARRGIPTSVILIRNSNGSHNPDEHMEMEDFVAGLKVLGGSVLKLS
jgi:N-carbamoyl-L-amino-acid hydrolase